MKGLEKAFRIACSIISGSGAPVSLGKAVTQTDQGSEMNVISSALRNQLGLPKYRLSDIGFQGLTMRTADHRDTPLEFWTAFTIIVEGISRSVRCFESPRVSIAGSAISEHCSLLLRLPWLFSVNAVLAIRDSKIIVEDPAREETMREIVGPEMIFCTEHTLLLYPREALSKNTDAKDSGQKMFDPDEDDGSESSDDESSADELSDIEDEKLF